MTAIPLNIKLVPVPFCFRNRRFHSQPGWVSSGGLGSVLVHDYLNRWAPTERSWFEVWSSGVRPYGEVMVRGLELWGQALRRGQGLRSGAPGSGPTERSGCEVWSSGVGSYGEVRV
jgi:hypothetical protein